MHGQGTVRTTNADAVAKAIVVRKFAARKSMRVRFPPVPLISSVICAQTAIAAAPSTGASCAETMASMLKPTASLLIAIGVLALVIGAPGVYLAIYAYAGVDVLNDGSFLITAGGIAIAAALGILAAYSADPGRSRFPAWVLSLVILAASVLAVGYDTVNRMQLERERTDAQQAQDALRRGNVALAAENARIRETAAKTYASSLALNRTSSRTLAAIQRETATTGLINQRTLGVATQAGALQSSALAALTRLAQSPKSSPCPPKP